MKLAKALKKSVRDIDPRMLDSKILEIAVSEGCMVITMDRDFGELVFNSGLSNAGVLSREGFTFC